MGLTLSTMIVGRESVLPTFRGNTRGFTKTSSPSWFGMLATFRRWMDNAALETKILVTNPAALYG